MIRTGEQYRDSIRDGREVYINGECVKDVTTHPAFKPIVDIRAKIYDMQHDEKTKAVMTVVQDGEEHAVGNILPKKQEDWWKKRKAVDTVMDTIGGVVTRVGDETVEKCGLCMTGRMSSIRLTHSFPKTLERILSMS